MAEWPELLRDAADVYRQVGDNAEAYAGLAPGTQAMYWLGSGKMTPDQLSPRGASALGVSPEHHATYAQRYGPYVRDQLQRGQPMSAIAAELGGLGEPTMPQALHAAPGADAGFLKRFGSHVFNAALDSTADPTNFLTGLTNNVVRRGLQGASPFSADAAKRALREGIDWQTAGMTELAPWLARRAGALGGQAAGLSQYVPQGVRDRALRMMGRPPGATAAPAPITPQGPAAPAPIVPPWNPPRQPLALPPPGGTVPNAHAPSAAIPRGPGGFQFPPWVREPRTVQPPLPTLQPRPPGAAPLPPPMAAPPPIPAPAPAPAAAPGVDAEIQAILRRLTGA